MSENLSWVEIDSRALKYNLAKFRELTGPEVLLMPIIKSNAYGHGIVEVANILSDSGVDYLGVVNGTEALLLRNKALNNPILVLSYFEKRQIKELIERNIDLVVYDFDTAEEISKIASTLNIIAKIHIKVDTGTSRLGILAEEAADFVEKCSKLSMVEIIGVFTHFADSENNDWDFTNSQIEKFRNLLFSLQRMGIKIPIPHAACSAATLVSANTHFNMVRVGIATYGLWPSENNKITVRKKFPDFELQPVLSWKTRIIQIKHLPKGSLIGYGCSYKLKKDSMIAILPIGYNEGYSRQLSNKGTVLVGGKKCPVIGKVCMNLTIIDVSNVDSVAAGDEVTIIGRQGKQEITADQIAIDTKSINYEVVTRINPQLPRIVI
ncbi:MAG: alanine racemase [Patescibacteria group bacterium]|jgi:alanine racemase